MCSRLAYIWHRISKKDKKYLKGKIREVLFPKSHMDALGKINMLNYHIGFQQLKSTKSNISINWVLNVNLN